MAHARTNRDLELTLWGSTVTIPKGTALMHVKGASGTRGDLWAVWSAKLLVELTGNAHDPKYRYAFVPDDAVECGPVPWLGGKALDDATDPNA